MEGDVQPFDLIGEPKLDDHAVEALAVAVQEAAIVSAETVAGVTRRPSTLTIGDILEPVRARDLPSEGVAVEIAMVGGAPLALLILTDENTVALADVFFGGPGNGADRRPAPIEVQAIVSSLPPIIEPVVAAVTASGGHEIQLRASDSVTAPSAELVRLDLAFDIDGVAIELAVFAPDPDKAGPATGTSSEMLQLAGEIPVQFDIDLGAVPMTAGEVQGLATGDIVIFDVGLDDEVTVRSGNRDFVRGSIEDSNGRRRLSVTEVLSTH